MKTGDGFFFKTNRGQKRIHLLLLPFMTHFYDADGDGGSSLSFSSQELHHYSDSFLYQFLPDLLFLLKKNGILHHIVDSFLLLLKKKEGLIILIHCDLHHFSDVLLLILHHLSDAFFFFPLKQTEASDLFCTIFVIHFCGILHQYYGAFLPISMKTRLILLIHYISFCITYPMHLFSLKETGVVISSSY